MSLDYVIVTPARNEAENILKTIESVLGQTVRPLCWVIVDDGSTDETVSIVRERCRNIEWIKVLEMDWRRPRRRGRRIVELFYAGYEVVRELPCEHLVKLDADVSFDSDFFERILREFGSSERLGISSGVSHIFVGTRWIEERSAKQHTLGATKVYRDGCFQAIGGLEPTLGWDGIDEIKARMKGWEARCIPGLIVRHHRPEGQASGSIKRCLEDGIGAYYMGYHPLFLLVRALWRMKSRPLVFGGIAMLAGYVQQAVHKGPKISDASFVEFVRREQLKKLLLRPSQV